MLLMLVGMVRLVDGDGRVGGGGAADHDGDAVLDGVLVLLLVADVHRMLWKT